MTGGDPFYVVWTGWLWLAVLAGLALGLAVGFAAGALVS